MKTLLKFAQEIDTGTISCVNFAVPGSLDHEPTMQMLCERDEHVVVALFHGLPGDDSGGSDAGPVRGTPPPSVEAVADRMRALVGQVRTEFSQQYGAQLEEQRVRPSSVDHWGTHDGDGDESEYDERVSNASLSVGRLSNPAHDEDEAGSGGGESGDTGTADEEGYNESPRGGSGSGGGGGGGGGGVDDASLDFGAFSAVLTRLCDAVLNPDSNSNSSNEADEGGGNSPQLASATAPAIAPTRI